MGIYRRLGQCAALTMLLVVSVPASAQRQFFVGACWAEVLPAKYFGMSSDEQKRVVRISVHSRFFEFAAGTRLDFMSVDKESSDAFNAHIQRQYRGHTPLLGGCRSQSAESYNAAIAKDKIDRKLVRVINWLPSGGRARSPAVVEAAPTMPPLRPAANPIQATRPAAPPVPVRAGRRGSPKSIETSPFQSGLPNPTLRFTGVEEYSTSKGPYTRYRYDVLNKASYPATLFSLSATLPACGTNKNASRAWVDFFDATGRRLYGFCALDAAAKLNQIWFALPRGLAPPKQVYIEITDRLTNKKYRSNLAGTSLARAAKVRVDERGYGFCMAGPRTKTYVSHVFGSANHASLARYQEHLRRRYGENSYAGACANYETLNLASYGRDTTIKSRKAVAGHTVVLESWEDRSRP